MSVDVTACLSDFEGFCKSGLQRTLRPYQVPPAAAIIRSVLQREGQSIALLMARQSGKNELIACLSIWLLLRFPGIKVGIYAPTLPQAVDISMRRIKRHWRRAATAAFGKRPAGSRQRGAPAASLVLRGLPLGDLLVPEPEVRRVDMLELPAPDALSGPFGARGEGSLLGAHSAEKDAEKEGFTWDLILYDEAQDMDRAVIDEEISPMGAATSATEVYIGTPYTVDCKFYDVIQAIKEGRVPGECFEYSWEAVAPHVPEYARFVKKKAAELGRNSIAFRTQYELEWVKGLGLFFDYGVFRTLGLEGEEFLSISDFGFRMSDLGTGRLPAEIRDPQSEMPDLYSIGIDLAGDDPGRTGRTDFTAVAVLRHEGERKVLVDLHAWQGKEWERQHDDIVRIVRGVPGRAQVAVDATGMGDPFSDRLQKAVAGRPIAVERLKLTSQSKSEVALYAEQEIAGGRVFYASGPQTREHPLLGEFLHQVRWLVREALPEKAVRWYVSPEKGHDDLVCAFFLALWASRRTPVCRHDLSGVVAVDEYPAL